MDNCKIGDFSMDILLVRQEFMNVAFEMQRPSILLKPTLYIDGNQWCALYGENIQVGLAGFGGSPAQAMHNFDVKYNESLVFEPKE